MFAYCVLLCCFLLLVPLFYKLLISVIDRTLPMKSCQLTEAYLQAAWDYFKEWLLKWICLLRFNPYQNLLPKVLKVFWKLFLVSPKLSKKYKIASL